MPRIRTIKPEFWSDEKIAKLSRGARLLFIGMWTLSDDYGVARANLKFISASLFPFDNLTLKSIGGWLDELIDGGFIIPFNANGESYFYIKHFKRHQVINRPSKFRNPQPPTLTEDSLNTHGIITVGTGEGTGREGNKGKGGESEGREEQTKSQKPFSLSKGGNPENPIQDIIASISEKKSGPGRIEEWEKSKERLRRQAKLLEAGN